MNAYDFLSEVKGVIHIGAHKGNERRTYRNYNINVIFVEAIPAVAELMKQKIGGGLNDGRKFVGLNYLVTDKDDAEYDFKISSNRGLSSSIYDFKDHKKIWTTVKMVDTLKLKSVTIPTMLQREKLSIDNYDALVMDTQGSEILVLKGAESIIRKFKYILTEVANFEAYQGCGQLKDIEDFMKRNGFTEHFRSTQVTKEGLGSYYDIVYKRD